MLKSDRQLMDNSALLHKVSRHFGSMYICSEYPLVRKKYLIGSLSKDDILLLMRCEISMRKQVHDATAREIKYKPGTPAMRYFLSSFYLALGSRLCKIPTIGLGNVVRVQMDISNSTNALEKKAFDSPRADSAVQPSYATLDPHWPFILGPRYLYFAFLQFEVDVE